MQKTSRDYQLGLVLVIVAVVAWSTAGLFTRYLSADTPTILFWRGLFGALGTVAVVAVLPGTGGIKTFRALDRSGVAYAALTALSMFFFITALRNTTVAHVAIVTAIVPFCAAYLGWALLGETPKPAVLVSSGIALAGVAIMAGISTDGHLYGDGFALLMALCMAGMILISRRFPGIPALPATCLASAFSALGALPFATIYAVSAQDMGLLALFGLVNQVIGFGLFAMGARLLPPAETALFTALEAPLAPLWVWIALSEVPGTAVILGGLMVFGAVLGHIRVANTGQNPRL